MIIILYIHFTHESECCNIFINNYMEICYLERKCICMGKIKNLSIIILQIAALFFISLAMNYIAKWMHLPIPGTILGIIVLFILLKTNVIKLSWIEQGANWLLAELLLFFIPAAVGVMNYMSLLERDGIRILLVVISSTIVVMASSGLVASRISKRKEQRAQ